MYIYDELDQGLDEEAWLRLSEQSPKIAQGLQKAVRHGATPDEVRRHVLDTMRDPDLAAACEQAARWLARGA